MHILKNATLADKVGKNFVRIKVKRYSVKVPSIKIGKIKFKKQVQSDKISVSALVNILIRNALEKVKREKEKKPAADIRKYRLLNEDISGVQGGYGAVSKNYGSLIHTSYVDYEKLFSYLGNFKAKNPYENMGDSVEFLNKSVESGSFVLADKDSMDKIGRFDKYMKTPGTAIQTMALSLVPIAGLSSGEWEEIKNLMRFDPVIYTLKSKTS